MTRKAWFSLLTGCALCGLGARAGRADVVVDNPTDDGEPWQEAALPSAIGVGLTLGGGVMGFAGRTLRDATSPVGGQWDLRAAFGTHTPIAIEAGYMGSAMQIESQLGRNASTLLGTTFEADVRLNLMAHYLVDPYVFAGVGWQRYTVDSQDFTLMMAGVASHADSIEVPLGGGLSYRADGLVFDVRGTFRAVHDPKLVLLQPELTARTPQDQRFAAMHSWGAELAVGYEF